MSEVWPFPADNQIIDAYEFATDLMKTRAAEKRFPIRVNPRRSITLNHILTDETFAKFKAIAERNSSYGQLDVPIWPDSIIIGSVSIAQTTFTFTTAGYDFTKKLILWSSYNDFEILNITTINAGSIVTATGATKAYSQAILIPCRLCQATSGFQVERSGYNNYEASVTFKVIDNVHPEPSDYFPGIGPAPTYTPDFPYYYGEDIEFGEDLVADTYKLIRVIPYRPNRNVSLTEIIYDSIREIDNISGAFYVDRIHDYTDFGQTIEFKSDNRTKINNLRQFVGYMMGRSEPFWLPSFFNEITLLDTAVSASLSFRVKRVLNLTEYIGRYTYLQLNNGTKIYSKITNAVNSSGEALLTIETATGLTIAPSDIFQFCFMTHVRSDSDEFIFSYEQGLVCTLSFPVMRVPAIPV